MEVAVVPLPYNGGRLAEKGLQLIEHPLSDEVDSLEAIALRHRPDLTAAEAAALEKVPPAESALNIGNSPGNQACSVVLLTVAVVVEVAIVVVTFTITGKVDIEHVEHFSDAELRELGPAATARELVQRRRTALMARPAKG